jgi:hypothetical protein
MRKALTLVLSLALPAALCACGSGSSSQMAEGLAGTYVLDVDRTPMTPSGGGSADARRLSAASRLGPNNLRYELLPDGTFRFEVQLSADKVTTSGTWTRTADGLLLTTTTANGQPVEGDGPTTETARVEPGYLVLDQGGRIIYLKRT